MEFRLTLSADVSTKSASVRRHMGRCLATNVRNALRRELPGSKVVTAHDHLVVRLPSHVDNAQHTWALDTLASTPGIQKIAHIQRRELADWRATLAGLALEKAEQVEGREFRIKVRRKGRHTFNSVDAERFLGAELLRHTRHAKVNLTHPDLTISLRLDGAELIDEVATTAGIGGFPLGTQDQALVLMSGGFDSPVAAYRMLRRGIKCHFILFRFGGEAQEQAVRQLTHDLWRRFSASHKVSFTSVPFEKVVDQLTREVPEGLVSLVLKRHMVAAAARVAQRARIPALVTGEVIAQVSSQTLSNLGLIDKASHLPVLRPLLTEDKQSIIDEARRIGTAQASSQMPEYCGGMSARPLVKTSLAALEEAEARLPAELLDDALSRMRQFSADDPGEPQTPSRHALDELTIAELTASADATIRVIDVRSPDEAARRPLTIAGHEVEHVPFYELATRAAALSRDSRYLLYCDQGIMSRLQALSLKDQGLPRVGVLLARSKHDAA
ncbi:tRNA uracil 4-sulfurtransferase ThiI [Halomonas cupida]|uniref:tRNA uracil 4-sulfurtransferase ThiI n=1 Tax=Halomonas TaxID=2745 RepID=UPI001A8C58B0|nr:tRNA uracil 4-sulfurtransferase ThiI [Halomonas litopenaei]MBN8411369.1 tRNA 4-thiouridine(8) synthase ThiI [Halomonas litopenaei]